MNKIAVIDYGMGNLRSVAKALEFVAPEASIVVTNSATDIAAADRVFLPGVGALRDCMAELHRLDLVEPLRMAAKSKPFMGICLGMQALLDHSEENGGVDGLGIVSGKVSRFSDDMTNSRGERLKIPHMGWNQVHHEIDHPMWRGIEQDARFYFVHSYYVSPISSIHCAGSTDYGVKFSSVISHDNVFAVQFHPEKSQQAGLALLRNFVAWNGNA